tara:strand:- start:2416 stop:2661 length:246 start_codon:yes stop_codon:yes gene_type:complete
MMIRMLGHIIRGALIITFIYFCYLLYTGFFAASAQPNETPDAVTEKPEPEELECAWMPADPSNLVNPDLKKEKCGDTPACK